MPRPPNGTMSSCMFMSLLLYKASGLGLDSVEIIFIKRKLSLPIICITACHVLQVGTQCPLVTGRMTICSPCVALAWQFNHFNG